MATKNKPQGGTEEENKPIMPPPKDENTQGCDEIDESNQVELVVIFGTVDHDGESYAAGDSLTASSKDADRLIRLGFAKEV